MKAYNVKAARWGVSRGWELYIDGIGVTQGRNLSEAETMARDYISLETGEDPGSIVVEMTYFEILGAGLA